MRILGISAFYHDSAAALVVDGEILAAAQEERFSRRRHDARFPAQAARFCLERAGVGIAGLDYVVFYDKPFLKFERLIETYLALAPRGLRSFAASMPLWVREKVFQRSLLCRQLENLGSGFDPEKLLFTEHHLAHAASAFYPSPFEEAAVLTMDGVGEWATTSFALGRGNGIEITKEIHFPHSLGLLYSAFTYYTGFRVNSGEYKLMGLAPYGSPRYAGLIRDRLIDVKPDGSFRLNLDYFDYCTGLKMINRQFEDLFGQPARRPEGELTEFHMDVAASVQTVLEGVVLKMTRSLAAEAGLPNLCLAGGVALNCVANGKILREGRFKRLWIQPAAGDAGGALGAALAAHHLLGRASRPRRQDCDAMQGCYLGPEFSQAEIERRLSAAGAVYAVLEDSRLIRQSACAIAEGKALGWFQGRMEFGPRALGARSILGDARSPAMQSILNLKVKYRESFRPFAPSVRAEDAIDWFNLDAPSPYMLVTAQVAQAKRVKPMEQDARLTGLARLKSARSEIPAVTHVDNSARVQTVHRETNPRYHALLTAFKEQTGCPVVVNTSFNVRGEPIVCTPEEAYGCFMATDIDSMAIGNCYLIKGDQPARLRRAPVFHPD